MLQSVEDGQAGMLAMPANDPRRAASEDI